MKLSFYIPIAFAVAALVFWAVPVTPDPVFYPISKDGVSLLPSGMKRLGVSGIPWTMECKVCKQPATRSTLRLEPGTLISAGIWLSCDQHASLPMLDRFTNKIVLSGAVLMLFAVVGVAIHRRQKGRNGFASELKT